MVIIEGATATVTVWGTDVGEFSKATIASLSTSIPDALDTSIEPK